MPYYHKKIITDGKLRPIKQALGWALAIIGVGLLLFPEQTLNFIIGIPKIIGGLLIFGGGMWILSARKRY